MNMIFLTRSTDLSVVVLFLLQVCIAQSHEDQATSASPQSPGSPTTSNCALYKYVGVNDLSVNDIVVKSEVGDLACVKAKFSLAIKVETEEENTLIAEPSDHRPGSPSEHQGAGRSESNSTNGPVENKRLVLGYLPLDSVVNVRDSCPNPKPQSGPAKDGIGGQLLLEEPKELDMVVSFECGRLTFTFKQEDKFYMSSIRGFVNLDSSTVREFTSEEPMFFTSDLTHHFKSSELIEVGSSAKSKAFILTANFYHLEFETFRNTSSRGFIRPPDEPHSPK